MRVCVFCGSNSGVDPAYRAAAVTVGTQLAAGGHELVYGGAAVGLMGAVADAALAGGGRVVGIIPRFLDEAKLEIGHRNLTELIVVENLHARKAKMAEGTDAFVVLPGGLGTFEEMFEVLTWAQLGLHRAPTILVNVRGFFAPLLALLDGSIAAGFMRPENRGLFVAIDDPGELQQTLAEARITTPPPKWMT
jgi:uncharacterized protein (TIGR00730 family)